MLKNRIAGTPENNNGRAAAMAARPHTDFVQIGLSLSDGITRVR